jgi:hypothetical protein
MTNLIVAFVMFVICIPTTCLVAFEVPEHPLEKQGILDDGTVMPVPIRQVSNEEDSGEDRLGRTL